MRLYGSRFYKCITYFLKNKPSIKKITEGRVINLRNLVNGLHQLRLGKGNYYFNMFLTFLRILLKGHQCHLNNVLTASKALFFSSGVSPVDW